MVKMLDFITTFDVAGGQSALALALDALALDALVLDALEVLLAVAEELELLELFEAEAAAAPQTGGSFVSIAIAKSAG